MEKEQIETLIDKFIMSQVLNAVYVKLEKSTDVNFPWYKIPTYTNDKNDEIVKRKMRVTYQPEVSLDLTYYQNYEAINELVNVLSDKVIIELIDEGNRYVNKYPEYIMGIKELTLSELTKDPIIPDRIFKTIQLSYVPSHPVFFE